MLHVTVITMNLVVHAAPSLFTVKTNNLVYPLALSASWKVYDVHVYHPHCLVYPCVFVFFFCVVVSIYNICIYVCVTRARVRLNNRALKKCAILLLD